LIHYRLKGRIVVVSLWVIRGRKDANIIISLINSTSQTPTQATPTAKHQFNPQTEYNV
jgi:hypothetical protein